MPEAQLVLTGGLTLFSRSCLVKSPCAVLRQSNALPEDLGMLEPGQYFIRQKPKQLQSLKQADSPTKEHRQEGK